MQSDYDTESKNKIISSLNDYLQGEHFRMEDNRVRKQHGRQLSKEFAPLLSTSLSRDEKKYELTYYTDMHERHLSVFSDIDSWQEINRFLLSNIRKIESEYAVIKSKLIRRTITTRFEGAGGISHALTSLVFTCFFQQRIFTKISRVKGFYIYFF